MCINHDEGLGGGWEGSMAERGDICNTFNNKNDCKKINVENITLISFTYNQLTPFYPGT